MNRSDSAIESSQCTCHLQVYLHSDEFFSTTSSHLADLITAIGGASRRLSSYSFQDDASRRLEAAGRQLQTLDNGVSMMRYECDDTLFECEPVCIETVTEDHLRDPFAKSFFRI